MAREGAKTAKAQVAGIRARRTKSVAGAAPKTIAGKAAPGKATSAKTAAAKADALSKSTALLQQDPHRVTGKRRSLESAIGREVRNFRHQLNMTVAQLAQAAG